MEGIKTNYANKESEKAKRASALRYKRPALDSMGRDAIYTELAEIVEACEDIRWYTEQGDDTLLNALDGDESEEWEFRMAFSDLSGKAEQLWQILMETDLDTYDDCTVALVGNRYNLIGYDTYEEDYFHLCRYEQNLAQTESGKRMMRYTKAEMLSIIGQSLGILIAFLDLRQQYDYLKATFDILRDENTSLLKLIQDIDAAYEAAEAEDFASWRNECKHYDALLEMLPDRIWLE